MALMVAGCTAEGEGGSRSVTPLVDPAPVTSGTAAGGSSPPFGDGATPSTGTPTSSTSTTGSSKAHIRTSDGPILPDGEGISKSATARKTYSSTARSAPTASVSEAIAERALLAVARKIGCTDVIGPEVAGLAGGLAYRACTAAGGPVQMYGGSRAAVALVVALTTRVQPAAVRWILWDDPVLLRPTSKGQSAALATELGVQPGFQEQPGFEAALLMNTRTRTTDRKLCL